MTYHPTNKKKGDESITSHPMRHETKMNHGNHETKMNHGNHETKMKSKLIITTHLLEGLPLTSI